MEIAVAEGSLINQDNIHSRFGKRLRSLRLKRGWTQKQMAVDLGFDRGHICDLERGKKSVTLRTMEIFARGLGIEIHNLLREI